MNPTTIQQVMQQAGQAVDAASFPAAWWSGPPSAWFVEQGSVDLYLVHTHQDQPSSDRLHLLRAEAGSLLLQAQPAHPRHPVDWIATSSPKACLRRLDLSQLQALTVQPDLAPAICTAIENWILSVHRALSLSTPPDNPVRLEPDTEQELPVDAIVVPGSALLWIVHHTGTSRLLNQDSLKLNPGSAPVATSADAWLHITEPTTLETSTTAQLAASKQLLPALDHLNTLAKTASVLLDSHRRTSTQEQLERQSRHEDQTLQQALSNLAEPLSPLSNRTASPSATPDPLLEACRLVCGQLGIDINPALNPARHGHGADPLQQWARAARIRLRRVTLRQDWWLHDNGPMLAYTRKDRHPVALLPTSPTSYGLVDPTTGTTRKLTADQAKQLHPTAYTFHRTLPDAALNAWQILRFTLQNTRPDLVMLLLMSLAGGALGMVMPLATSLVIDVVIPGSVKSQLLFVSLSLLVAAAAGVIFELTRGIALVRLEGKTDTTLQGAVWDRLLNLPLPFFRRYTAGDLAMRANGISTIQEILTGAVITSVLGAVFSLFNFALLFYFSGKLALIASALVAVNLSVVTAVSLLSLRLQRPLYDTQGKISGLVLQLITAIHKLRVAGAEARAYSVWARSFAKQKSLDLQVTRLNNKFTVFNDAYPLITSMCLFSAAIWITIPDLTTGRFLAFASAFSLFLYATLEAGQALLSVLHALPVYERAKPVLETLPEIDALKSPPGQLRGRIELNQVSFRYQPDSPPVLQNVSLQIEPGECVAIVGPSGSGKSTLLRLLLGFEKPEAGSLSYDGMDLAGLDVLAVRRQMGVVLQNGKLLPGDIYENIVGSSLFTLDDAWDAARRAGLEPDIQAMPMGMHTVLGEGGETLSGGQKQRLMIARAIIGKPRILLFDEATSALDNRTQATVTRNLGQLGATQVIIAHRLSTIMNADRILVLQQGRIVQTGTYQELIQQAGPFQDLARRQLA
ncbi:MAG: hypothetical protein RI897_1232 [Verrucomicrobiota bacterium]|jgi:NHLM bacteriocin system ABC transporter ATP-binding protein